MDNKAFPVGQSHLDFLCWGQAQFPGKDHLALPPARPWSQEYCLAVSTGEHFIFSCRIQILYKLQLCSPLVLESNVKIRREMHIHLLKLYCSMQQRLQVLTKSINSVIFLLRRQREPQRLERKAQKSIYPRLARGNFRRFKAESFYTVLYVHFHLLLFAFVCMSCAKLTVNGFIYFYDSYGIVVADIYCCGYYL